MTKSEKINKTEIEIDNLHLSLQSTSKESVEYISKLILLQIKKGQLSVLNMIFDENENPGKSQSEAGLPQKKEPMSLDIFTPFPFYTEYYDACDGCGCYPHALYKTSHGSFCEKCYKSNH